MTSTIGNSASKPVASWYMRAAWYSLLVPLTSPVWGFLLFAFTNGYLGIMMASALWILASGIILGLTSLLGIAKCGAGRILWKAGIGIPLNAILGFVSYVYWAMLHGFHG